MFGRNSKKEKAEKEEKTVFQEIFGMIIYLLGVLVLTYLVVTFLGQRTLVKGSSMEPMLQDADNLIVDKISYRFKDPKRFDIIVFPFQYQEKTYYIKRIIGLPGETVLINEEGVIYIDGEVLEEDYGAEVMHDSGLAEQAITLGANEYFVLGDNRNNSSDSRDPSVGNIRKEDIIGRAWLRVWPIKNFGVLKHQ